MGEQGLVCRPGHVHWGSLLDLPPALEFHPAAHTGWAWHRTPGWQTHCGPWLAPGRPQASPARGTQGRCAQCPSPAAGRHPGVSLSLGYFWSRSWFCVPSC